jgi:hypothetical protein
MTDMAIDRHILLILTPSCIVLSKLYDPTPGLEQIYLKPETRCLPLSSSSFLWRKQIVESRLPASTFEIIKVHTNQGKP